MSKRSGPTSLSAGRQKQLRHVFFLDRNLCAEGLPARLRDAGYNLVAYNDEYGRVHNQQISDPQIIHLCGEKKRILISADKRMEFQYAPEIYAAKIAVVLLVNMDGGAEGWIQRLVAAQDAIRNQMVRRRKPLLIRVAQDGTLTILKLYRKKGQRTVQLY